jgi:xanthine/CO dehydrogenase XdhC/CoxF family maturation factor
MLGPRRRTDQLLDELRSDGLSFGDEDLARLYAPIGLDIGAAAPETIAVAIVAEIQSALAHREGGYLRDRTAPIYDRK